MLRKVAVLYILPRQPHPMQIKEIPWFESVQFDHLHERDRGVILDDNTAFEGHIVGQGLM